MGDYYIADGGQQRGPYPAAELAGRGVRPDTMVWSPAMTHWAPAREVPELAAALAGAWAMPPVPPGFTPGGAPWQPPGGYPTDAARANASGTKLAAGLCGILLGGFGIHKFVLGMTTPGLILLLSTVLTCGFGGMVTGVIGLIEGIIYLTKSDDEFHRIYVVEKKQWF